MTTPDSAHASPEPAQTADETPPPAPAKRMHPLAAGTIGAVLGVLGAVVVGAAIGLGGSDEATSSTDNTTTASVRTSTSADGHTSVKSSAPTSAPSIAPIGSPARSGNVIITVSQLESGAHPQRTRETSYGPAGVVNARSGGEIVGVHAVVKNETSTAMDLTCGLPFMVELQDDKDRRFPPIQGLYAFEGNPECNANLNPGFDSKITYYFEVPVGTKIDAFAFAELRDGKSQKTAFVDFRK